MNNVVILNLVDKKNLKIIPNNYIFNPIIINTIKY